MSTKIFVFCNGCSPDWHTVAAIGADGRSIAGHICSNHGFVRFDFGFEGTRKHGLYNAAYPAGWELVWIPDGRQGASAELDAAFAENAKLDQVVSEVRP